MARTRTVATMVGGCLAAGLILFTSGEPDVLAAKRKRGRRGRALTVQTVNVETKSGVKSNEIIQVRFSTAVDARTINPAVFRIREENADQTGFTKQIFADFQIVGNIVRVYPRLPTHLRDPDDPERGFYAPGTARDDALENAGLKPGKRYEMTILGHPNVSPVRTRAGRPLRRSYVTRFTVEASSDPSELYTTRTFADSPPPQIVFSNPQDRAPGVSDQYTATGGAVGVRTDIPLALVGTKVPISPTTLRTLGNVSLTLLSRRGDPSVRRPLAATPYIEQNFSTSLLVVEPDFALSDVSTFALRLSKKVKDLTEEFDFQPNRDRERLREIYDQLNLLRISSPNTPVEELQGPSASLIPDWPADAASRGILRRNVLAVGDAFPDEIDPRVILMFTTRDEEVTEDQFVYDFEKSERLFDARLSTAEIDDDFPSAAYAIRTIAGGTAANGDLKPEVNVTLSGDDPAFPGGVMNFREVVIPDGVTVRVTGSRPVQMRAIKFRLDGEINLDGSDGEKGSTSTQSSISRVDHAEGGVPGPGGGAGADASTEHRKASSNGNRPKGNTGDRGNDVDDNAGGGFGGLGGQMATGTYYSYSGGGGGGGSFEDGEDGQGGAAFYTSWNGAGGQGGNKGLGEDLDPLVGGAGGGSGGNGVSSHPGWTSWGYKTGSGGGGGGGAIIIQSAKRLEIGPTGLISSRGGDGGDIVTGSYGPGGPAGGGGGGAILLRSGDSVLIESPTTSFEVSGGSGGQGNQGNSYQRYSGGDGGAGLVRVEDPDGGQVVNVGIPGAGSAAGVYDPVGGGLPSFVYTKFADLGVSAPRILQPTKEDIETDAAQNDAVLVEMQFTAEDPSVFGQPDLSAIDDDTQGTFDTDITSEWLPVKMHDLTGTPGGAIPTPGYDPVAQGPEYVFPLPQEIVGKNYRFIRFRVTFQLDDAHARFDPLPRVDKVTIRFQFNF